MDCLGASVCEADELCGGLQARAPAHHDSIAAPSPGFSFDRKREVSDGLCATQAQQHPGGNVNLKLGSVLRIPSVVRPTETRV